MSCLLSIDTAGESISVALQTETVRDCLTNDEKNRHTEHTIPMIDSVLRRNALTVANVTGVAFGMGPGSFTGLRVACGVAQGIGFARAVQLYPVSNLRAAAMSLKMAGESGRVLVALDARMQECYVQAFDLAGQLPEALGEPGLVKPEQIGQWVARHTVTRVSGSAVAAYGERIGQVGCSLDEAARADAAMIALLAADMAARGEGIEPAQAHPLYIRNRVALTISERAAGQKL